MSEPVAERLSRLTPAAAGFDRDAVLFAAGRASARPNRRWVAVAAALAACQLLTLVLLWPRPGAPPQLTGTAPPEPVAIRPSPPRKANPSELCALSRLLREEEGGEDLPPPRPAAEPTAPAPPLSASGLPPSLLN